MKKIRVSPIIIQEAQNIVDGVYAPLEGFLNEEDFSSVLDNMRLANGSIWSIPVLFDVSKREAKAIAREDEIFIEDNRERVSLENIKVYKFPKDKFARKIFQTTSREHPGVLMLSKMGDYLVSGRVSEVNPLLDKPINWKYYLRPEATREIFRKNKWRKIVAFQTRNPPHLSHEYIQKRALKHSDGLFINPIIGPKKAGDFHDRYILGAYKKLIDNYYPQEKTLLGTFHTFMRYAGPREAVFHELVRKNFGCTQMIIGRDHAGVGNFYGPYAAQEIFNNFSEKELGIAVLRYRNAVFCKKCNKIVLDGTCEHEDKDKLFISGTELREKLTHDDDIPKEFMRKEVSDYLRKNRDKLFV
jgi:sulfate adenylyltransferase